MKNDPGLDAVRKARSDISREFGNDPVRLIAHYSELQANFKGAPLIHGPEGNEYDADKPSTDSAHAGAADADDSRYR